MKDELIIRHLAGETSSEEEKQLRTWLAQLPENERYYDNIKKVFELTSTHLTKTKQEIDIDINQEWKKFVGTIDKKETPVRTLIQEESFRPWFKIAAAVLLVAASGFVINYFILKTEEIKFQTTNSTQFVTLPDGSTITLNQYSELSYSSGFGDRNRSVQLKGEAFFEVKPDAQKPFIINVNNAAVEVVGTSFNIQGYDSRGEIEVTVQTGVVKFSVSELNKEVKLQAGQKGIYSKVAKELRSTTNQDVNFLAWNTRTIVFAESDLRSVVETLSKTYQVNISLPAVIPSSCAVTVTFEHQSLESVLNVLKTTLNLEYRITGQQVEILSAGC
jgi:transmembrane sensor